MNLTNFYFKPNTFTNKYYSCNKVSKKAFVKTTRYMLIATLHLNSKALCLYTECQFLEYTNPDNDVIPNASIPNGWVGPDQVVLVPFIHSG